MDKQAKIKSPGHYLSDLYQRVYPATAAVTQTARSEVATRLSMLPEALRADPAVREKLTTSLMRTLAENPEVTRRYKRGLNYITNLGNVGATALGGVGLLGLYKQYTKLKHWRDEEKKLDDEQERTGLAKQAGSPWWNETDWSWDGFVNKIKAGPELGALPPLHAAGIIAALAAAQGLTYKGLDVAGDKIVLNRAKRRRKQEEAEYNAELRDELDRLRGRSKYAAKSASAIADILLTGDTGTGVDGEKRAGKDEWLTAGVTTALLTLLGAGSIGAAAGVSLAKKDLPFKSRKDMVKTLKRRRMLASPLRITLGTEGEQGPVSELASSATYTVDTPALRAADDAAEAAEAEEREDRADALDLSKLSSLRLRSDADGIYQYYKPALVWRVTGLEKLAGPAEWWDKLKGGWNEAKETAPVVWDATKAYFNKSPSERKEVRTVADTYMREGGGGVAKHFMARLWEWLKQKWGALKGGVKSLLQPADKRKALPEGNSQVVEPQVETSQVVEPQVETSQAVSPAGGDVDPVADATAGGAPAPAAAEKQVKRVPALWTGSPVINKDAPKGMTPHHQAWRDEQLAYARRGESAMDVMGMTPSAYSWMGKRLEARQRGERNTLLKGMTPAYYEWAGVNVPGRASQPVINNDAPKGMTPNHISWRGKQLEYARRGEADMNTPGLEPSVYAQRGKQLETISRGQRITQAEGMTPAYYEWAGKTLAEPTSRPVMNEEAPTGMTARHHGWRGQQAQYARIGAREMAPGMTLSAYARGGKRQTDIARGRLKTKATGMTPQYYERKGARLAREILKARGYQYPSYRQPV